MVSFGPEATSPIPNSTSLPPTQAVATSELSVPTPSIHIVVLVPDYHRDRQARRGMLERATACLDPAVQYLFRQVERPTRSSRLLYHSFWRNGGDDIDVPAWWPLYLNELRKSSRARSYTEPASICSPDLHRHSITKHERLVRRPHGRRNIASQSASNVLPGRAAHRQTYSPSSAYNEDLPTKKEEADHIGVSPQPSHLRPQGESSSYDLDDVQELVKGEMIPTGSDAKFSAELEVSATDVRQTSDTSATPLQMLLSSDRQDAYDEVWQAFVRLKSQEESADHVLLYLSTSSQPKDLKRALEAYNMIPRDQRHDVTYRCAIRAALYGKTGHNCYNPRLALQIHREAVLRSMGAETSRILFGYLVRHNYWKAAASALLELLKTLRARSIDQHGLAHMRDVDEMTDLPEKLSSLCRRLQQLDPMYRSELVEMRFLARHLLARVVASSKIMAVITGEGLLSLFDKFQGMGLLQPKHYLNALHTLRVMRDARNRSQLAALLYRNLRYRLPDFLVPRWVYGSLIVICSEANHPSHAIRFILDEFRQTYGRPDREAYQKVLSACAILGDSQSVHEVFKCLCKDYGSNLELPCLTPLLYVYARVGDVENTRRQFRRLNDEFNIIPNTYCWNIILTAYSRAKDTHGAFQTFKQMKAIGLRPDAYSYGTLMGMCANAGDTAALHKMVERARADHVTGTSPMVDTLVHSYCLHGEVETAESLVDTATKLQLEGSQTRMWNILLRHYAFQGDSEAVLRTQNRMRSLAVKPDEMTYAALMSALVVLGKTQEAAKILRSLHFSQHLTATLFHYSIILHGHVLEGNRDMATVIYNEILERFPKPSVSARLAMLHHQFKRDLTIAGPQHSKVFTSTQTTAAPHTLKALADTIMNMSRADGASKDPQPGLQRRSASNALPSVYMEFLIASLNRRGAFEEAQQLLSLYEDLVSTMPLGRTEKSQQSIQLLTALMIGAAKNQEYALVQQYWDQAVSRAVSHAQQLPRDFFSTPKNPVKAPKPPKPPTGLGLDFNDTQAHSSFKAPKSALDEAGLSILPAYRFILAAPLTQYMQALRTQKLVSSIPMLLQKLQNTGFALTARNWNVYIQALAQSSEVEHNLLAFQLFESKMLTNTPPWPLLRRGKWTANKLNLRTLYSTEGTSPVPRRSIERFQPDQVIPTYLTVVHLGAVLMRFRKKASEGDVKGLHLLRKEAWGTVKLVTAMPYSKDRVQGLILRRRKLQGDLAKRPRRQPEADTSGLRGGKSPLDHVPIDYLSEIQKELTETQQGLGSSALFGSDKLQTAEKYTGEILRSPVVLERANRPEIEESFWQRLQSDRGQKIAVLRAMKEEANRPRMVSDSKLGEPHLAAISPTLKADNNTSERSDGKFPKIAILIKKHVGRLRGIQSLKDRRRGGVSMPATKRRLDGSTLNANTSASILRRRRPTRIQAMNVLRPFIRSRVVSQRRRKAFSINKAVFARRKAIAVREMAARRAEQQRLSEPSKKSGLVVSPSLNLMMDEPPHVQQQRLGRPSQGKGPVISPRVDLMKKRGRHRQRSESDKGGSADFLEQHRV